MRDYCTASKRTVSASKEIVCVLNLERVMPAIQRVLRTEKRVRAPMEVHVIHLVEAAQSESTQIEALREGDVHYTTYNTAHTVKCIKQPH